ncbi:hypothetical protein ACE38W_01345 [Chitinophaga sp. Hz27]|uniref:hypothetical protein n=1 Tax=Chitinophaga sp. Hz27 TaxID=3347169 RepID=UPI0035D56BD6
MRKISSIDSIVGAGGGTLIIKLAQNLPDSHPLKSWLIILAPAIALFIRYLWNFLSPEVTFRVKRWRTARNRKNLVCQIDSMLMDPILSEESKALLKVQSEQVKLSIIDELFQHIESTLPTK